MSTTPNRSGKIYVDYLCINVEYHFLISRDSGEIFIKEEADVDGKFLILRGKNNGLAHTMFPFYVDDTTWIVKYVPGLFDTHGAEYQFYNNLIAYFTFTQDHHVRMHPVNRENIPITWDVSQSELKRDRYVSNIKKPKHAKKQQQQIKRIGRAYEEGDS